MDQTIDSDLWRLAFDADPDAVFLHDENHRIIWANRAYLEQAGSSLDQVLRRPYWEIFPPGTGPLPGCVTSLREGGVEDEKIVLDESRVLRNRSFAIRGAAGDYRASIHFLQDVSDYERIMRERRLALLTAERGADIVFLLASDGRLLFFNQSARDALGYTGAELAELGIPSIEVGLTSDEWTRRRDSLRTTKSIRSETRFQRKNGTTFPVRLSVNLVTDEGKHYVVAAARDTSAEEFARCALQESENAYHTLLERMSDGFSLCETVVDEKGQTIDLRLLDVNPAYERIIGHRSESLLGKTLKALLPDVAGTWVARLGQVAASGTPANFSQFVPCLARHPELRAISPEPGLVACLISDVTERTRLERSLRTLSAVNHLVIQASDEISLVEDLCQTITTEGGYPLAWVGYPEPESTRLSPVGSSDDSMVFLRQHSFDWMAEATRDLPPCRAARNRTPFIVRDLGSVDQCDACREYADAFQVNAVISLPLLHDGELLGVLSIYAAEVGAFTRSETALLQELGDDLAYGITTLRTRQAREQAEATAKYSAAQLKKTLVDTIQAISTALEKRDPYTAGHQHRVSQLAVAMGEELGLDEQRLEGLRLGALIHDIGKIYVPAEILNRPGRLTDSEFALIKSHAEVGYDIVKQVEFPWQVAKMVLQHHERLDGTGYPHGIRGDEIMFEARVLAVADTVEAMASHRPYRPGLGIDTALEEIRRGRGSAYDSQVVDACERLFRVRNFCFDADGLND